MTAVLLRARAEIKARWRVWLSLMLMLGVFGGAVMAIAAGARRTDSAYPRFLEWSRAPDVSVPHFATSIGGGAFGRVRLSDVEALPQVADSGGYTTQFVIFSGTAGGGGTGIMELYSQSGTPLNAHVQ